LARKEKKDFGAPDDNSMVMAISVGSNGLGDNAGARKLPRIRDGGIDRRPRNSLLSLESPGPHSLILGH
jgi:hypothetical protein